MTPRPHSAQFEAMARADDPDLVFYYADHRSKPVEALAVAEREAAVRQDVRTLDAYAWALFKNGKYTEAKAQMDKVLAVGVREPRYFCHAASIATAAGDRAGAEKFRKDCRE